MVCTSDTKRMAEHIALLIHQPCPDCGSSDALTINEDNSTKCFSCGVFKPGDSEQPPMIVMNNTNKTTPFIEGDYQALESRGIDEATCRKYRYQVGKHNGNKCHIANYYDIDGQKIAMLVKSSDAQGSLTTSLGRTYGLTLRLTLRLLSLKGK